MPAGCPPKRPSDAMESSQEGSSSAPKIKLPRLERGPEEFSQVVKNKLQSYTRTGQACDRCKVGLSFFQSLYPPFHAFFFVASGAAGLPSMHGFHVCEVPYCEPAE